MERFSITSPVPVVGLAVAVGLVLAMAWVHVGAANADPDDIVFKLHQRGFRPGPRKDPAGKVGIRVKGRVARLYDLRTGKPIGPPLKHIDRRPDTRITCWAFSPNGKRVATATGDPEGKAEGDSAGEVIVWDIATGQDLATISDRKADVGYVNAIAFKNNRVVLVECEHISGK